LGGWEKAAAEAMSSCGICADRFILSGDDAPTPKRLREEATVTTVTKQEHAHGLTKDS
jgi:hypothetical protein